ncbi:MAG: hypothetical protein EAZ15_07560 [Sphingobacteriales bacterium]|nr:MAG: hypothetical protein EAZ15_07560 [Sphingobacteriales bacterium]
MLKPNIYSLLFTILCVGAIELVQSLMPTQNLLIPKFWVIFGFISAITLLAINICLLVTKNKNPHSTFIILAVNVIKLLFCMTLAILYLQIYTVKPVLFITNFFLVYLLFTSFEIYTLLVNLRHLNKKIKTSN